MIQSVNIIIKPAIEKNEREKGERKKNEEEYTSDENVEKNGADDNDRDDDEEYDELGAYQIHEEINGRDTKSDQDRLQNSLPQLKNASS